MNANVDSADKFDEIVESNDGTEYHYDCGVYERCTCLNIELTSQHHFTLGKILDHLNVNDGMVDFFVI